AHAPRARANAADEEIVRRLKAAPNPAATWVVTSDLWLTEQAHALGAAVQPSASFRDRIEG
ncbi:MAG TPA: RNA-binding protein, partial [Conexibacter sp.]|nr:RNA-binding protein [Conexibacter sp.]